MNHFRNKRISNVLSGLFNDPLDFEVNFEEEGITALGSDGKWHCVKCLKHFSNRGNAQKHYKDVHLVNQPTYCQYCQREFKNKNSLRQHLYHKHNIRQKELKGKIVIPSLKF